MACSELRSLASTGSTHEFRNKFAAVSFVGVHSRRTERQLLGFPSLGSVAVPLYSSCLVCILGGSATKRRASSLRPVACSFHVEFLHSVQEEARSGFRLAAACHALRGVSFSPPCPMRRNAASPPTPKHLGVPHANATKETMLASRLCCSG